MAPQAQNLNEINSCASVAAYTLRSLADALDAFRANGGELNCCAPQSKTDPSA